VKRLPVPGRRIRAVQVITTPASHAAVPVERTWPGLYLGEWGGAPVCAGPQTAALVLGPPRSGKTSSVIIPCVASAPGPVVATSTKTDVVAVTGHVRHKVGTCWVFDPSASLETPEGCRPATWTPVTGCEDWDTALARATALTGAARPAGDDHEAPHWRERAEALLAALLHAADVESFTILAVLQWVLRHDTGHPLDILERHGPTPVAADVLKGIAKTELRERSGIFSTAAGVLSAYRSANVLEAAKVPTFDPDAFVRSRDTLYICAPAITQARFAPLPLLPEIVSEGGGQGLITLACLQDLAQARVRWGQAAEGFLSLFGTKLILPGIGDMRTLQAVSALAGEYDRVYRTGSETHGGLFTPKTYTTSWNMHRQAVLPPDAVAHGWPEHALAILGPNPPSWVHLTPWWTEPWLTHLRRP
jgi:type IV secretion system protein VirD4